MFHRDARSGGSHARGWVLCGQRAWLTVAALLALALPAFGATIELNDGSLIEGEPVALADGVYTVQTDALGTIRIRAERVRQIRSGAGTPAASGVSADAAGAVSSIQATLAADPGMVSRILSMQDNPQMQAILSDPEVMQAIQRFDLEVLRNHPKIRALMADPDIREIQREMR